MLPPKRERVMGKWNETRIRKKRRKRMYEGLGYLCTESADQQGKEWEVIGQGIGNGN
jgi:hypothetical protein